MVENKIDEYSRISGLCGDDFLDRKIERKEILGCFLLDMIISCEKEAASCVEVNLQVCFSSNNDASLAAAQQHCYQIKCMLL